MGLFTSSDTDDKDESDDTTGASVAETSDEDPRPGAKDGDEEVRVEVTQEVTRDYTEHKAKLLNGNATRVRRVTFDYMKEKNGRVHLGNYTGITRTPFHGETFQKETFLSFGTNQFALETTHREQKTMTDEATSEGDMERSEAETADNVEIIDE